jgi:tetratricopeptide (TPR) repeat protein
MIAAPSTLSTGLPRPGTPLRLIAALCLLTAAAVAQNPVTAPASATPPAASQPAPAPGPDTITKALPAQPGSKPISRRQALKAADAFLAGSAYLDKNEPEKAQKEFERAAALNPSKQEYALSAAIARENVVSQMVRKAQIMRSTGNNAGAASLLAAAAKIDPDNQLVTEHLPSASEPLIEIFPNTVSSDSGKLVTLAAPLELAPDQTLQSFHYRADAHEMVRRVLQAYGLKAQFNPDAPASSVRMDVDNLSFQQMLPILQQLSRSFLVPLDAKTALVVKDTRENHDQFDHLSLETIYMPGLSTEQITDVSNLLRQVLEIEHVTVNAASGTMSIRAPKDMLTLANYELADLLDGGNEVLMDMRVYSITKSNTKNIGFAAGTTLSAFNLYTEEQQIMNQYSSQITSAIQNGLIPANTSALAILGYLVSSGLLSSNALATGQILGTFGGGITWTGVTASALPTFNFGLNHSEAKSLDEVQLRVADRQTATFRAGTRYPIITASYSSGITSSQLAGLTSAQLAAYGLTAATAASALTSATIPQIQYEDLGLTLKAVPTVLRSGNVSLAIDLKIEALAGSALNGIPVLASRTLTSNVTIAPGETAVMVSSMTRQESRAVNGLPGLAEIPGFQSLTSDDSKGLDTSELVISLTPRLVRHGRDRITSRPVLFPRAAAHESSGGDEN